jgi:hypothetical protein
MKSRVARRARKPEMAEGRPVSESRRDGNSAHDYRPDSRNLHHVLTSSLGLLRPPSLSRANPLTGDGS